MTATPITAEEVAEFLDGCSWPNVPESPDSSTDEINFIDAALLEIADEIYKYHEHTRFGEKDCGICKAYAAWEQAP
jgi:hypothetical protein